MLSSTYQVNASVVGSNPNVVTIVVPGRRSAFHVWPSGEVPLVTSVACATNLLGLTLVSNKIALIMKIYVVHDTLIWVTPAHLYDASPGCCRVNFGLGGSYRKLSSRLRSMTAENAQRRGLVIIHYPTLC